MQGSSSSGFSVESAGRILEGFSMEQVSGALAARFRLKPSQIGVMLSRRMVIKRGLTKAGAQKLEAALKASGLDVSVPELTFDPEPCEEPFDLDDALPDAIPTVPVSPAQRAGLIAAAGLSLVVPLLYIGVIVAATAGLIWYLTLIPGLLAESGSLAHSSLVVSVPVVCSLLLLFLARPLFTKHPQPSGVPLDRQEHQRLFNLVDALCQRMGLAPVQAICVDNRPGVTLRPSGGLGSLRNRESTLTVGLPLLASLDVRQLIGAVSYELGHWAHPTTMYTSCVIRTVNSWLAGWALAKDAWDVRLDCWQDKSPAFVGHAVLRPAQAIIGVTRRLFRGMYRINLRVTRYPARKMEYEADRYGCWLAGSKTFEITAETVHSLVYAGQSVQEANDRALEEGKLMRNLPLAIVETADNLTAEQRRAVQTAMGDAQAFSWEAHPADVDRIRHALELDFPGVIRLEEPAAKLLEDFESLCGAITRKIYADSGVEDVDSVLVDNDEILGFRKSPDQNEEALEQYFNGHLTSRFLQLEAGREGPQTLQQIIDTLRSRLPELAALQESFFKTARVFTERTHGRVLLAEKIAIQPREFGLNSQELREADRLVEEASREWRELGKRLRDLDHLFARRMQLAIDQMSGADARNASALLASLSSFAGLNLPVRHLSSYSATLEALLNEGDRARLKRSEPAIHHAANRCRESIIQFYNAAARTTLSLPGHEATLREQAAASGLVGSSNARELKAGALDAREILRVAHQCDALSNDMYVRSMAALAKLCAEQEARLGVRPLKLLQFGGGAMDAVA